jgi:effector-binding domain-containing protein
MMEHAVTIVTTAAAPTAVVREATTWEAFPNRWGQLLDEVWTFVRRAGVTAGRNVMLYTDDVPNVEVGVEVSDPFPPSERVVASSVPAGRAARTIAPEPPTREGLAAAHAAVLRWCEANGEQTTRVRWEVYGHWRDDDPEGFETEIYWLLCSARPAPRGAVM